ncbi:MAG: sulfopyruvate decarboxylase subunit alpha [Alphaproteobacteria bacterium]|uniref:Sulfopyruvate decarboxylase subunit alpha n=1 Tax=Candidatus Nitrobium versatile TaxID=2884831 RepID=A0A953J5W7_9BACT|nr:sulfopyruvate decarboxylase subunit alpha [Candidatus Nitrobium versatile]
MLSPEKELVTILRNSGVDLACTLPCDRIKGLIALLEEEYRKPPLHHIPLTREEEGVGICAGAALAGRRPAMFLQNSGIGNMLNALLSLTGFYQLPLALFISHRGVYKEKIAAQVPMGEKVPGILKGAGIPHSVISTREELRGIGKKLDALYKKGTIHAFLLSPAVWETGGECRVPVPLAAKGGPVCTLPSPPQEGRMRPRCTRYEVLETVAPLLEGSIVVCNLGVPSKELFHLGHRSSYFYMLGSMGMATPIGLGIALSTEREVVVIDGDGSLLMNPGSLATAAYCAPDNLTILAIDNSAYGSTGNQPTFSGTCVDLERIAQGFGIRRTCKAAGKRQLIAAIRGRHAGLRFIHCLAVPGNRDVPNIPLHHLDIRKQVQEFLAGASPAEK